MQSQPDVRTKGRLLIVSPTFHAYWRPIEQAFETLGWEVRTYRYDENTSIAAKFDVKVRSELPRRFGAGDGTHDAEVQSRRARAAVHAFQPDRVLVVKGDTLTEPFWDALDRPRIPRSLWLYDELRRTRHTTESLARFDSIASYSRNDNAALQASGLHAAHVPLAFDTSLEFRPRHLNEVTFIGARYPKRADSLQGLHDAGVPVRAFGRDWSANWFDRARTWRLRSPAFATSRDLARSDAYGVMAGCPATLNIHGDQDGFTMRTFEAAGVGAVQLIDRADVVEFYDPGTEVAVFTNEDELIELARRSIADDRWGDRLRDAARRRTLAEHTFLRRAQAITEQW